MAIVYIYSELKKLANSNPTHHDALLPSRPRKLLDLQTQRRKHLYQQGDGRRWKPGDDAKQHRAGPDPR